jgi:hypothetical protein
VTLASTVAAFSLALGGGHLALQPVIAAPDGQLYVTLTGVKAPDVSMQIEGGLASGGRWFRWVRLHPTGPGSWRVILRAPGFLGVYPLEVRIGGQVLDAGPIVRILPSGFDRQPGFFTPLEVAQWWAQTNPLRPQLLATSTWRSGFFTHRDPDLNLLLRVRVLLPGHRFASTRYLSIARLNPTAPWRLLETVAAP